MGLSFYLLGHALPLFKPHPISFNIIFIVMILHKLFPEKESQSIKHGIYHKTNVKSFNYEPREETISHLKDHNFKRKTWLYRA